MLFHLGAGAEATAGQAAAVGAGGRSEAMFAFVRDVEDAILAAYCRSRAGAARPWGERERRWQTPRRSRRVEFNLLYDRGTVTRPAHRRARRVDPDVAAARGALGIRLRAGAGHARAESLAAIVAKRDWAT